MIDTPEKQAAPDIEPDRSGRRVWWIVGGVATGALLLFGATVAGVWIWTVSSPEETDSRSETYTQLDRVDVAVEVGDIEVGAVDGTAVDVLRETRWRGSEPEVEEEMRGGELSLDGDCDDRLFFWGGGQCQIDYTIGLPSGTAAEVENSVGEVRLDGLDGALEVEASVGGVFGTGLRTTETSVDSGVGSVRLHFAEVRGDIDVTTGTGDIEILVPDDGTTYDIVFDSGVGDQNIQIATDPGSRADYVIEVSSGVGDLTVRYAD